jgi:hypothetical protein
MLSAFLRTHREWPACDGAKACHSLAASPTRVLSRQQNMYPRQLSRDRPKKICSLEAGNLPLGALHRATWSMLKMGVIGNARCKEITRWKKGTVVVEQCANVVDSPTVPRVSADNRSPGLPCWSVPRESANMSCDSKNVNVECCQAGHHIKSETSPTLVRIVEGIRLASPSCSCWLSSLPLRLLGRQRLVVLVLAWIRPKMDCRGLSHTRPFHAVSHS